MTIDVIIIIAFVLFGMFASMLSNVGNKEKEGK